ncbi:DUF2059 domain-containing protein [Bosea sp. SSUT16]|jgi:hypothetical protein|uniref:DUF2059 domain-containing protein n=1 Tax=Bosea spartocytisi TaxID=2773451 RepID=A0A927HYA7_9HYPH|nr:MULTISPECIES: DUF2059 domain-containing protein [Bosea]MBD3844226.1 DUF2059 domain-containing protein [Bosea spartocytisi]MCT4470665.1 DUF2059 domain-containing protein [Bosea spartocytisi]
MIRHSLASALLGLALICAAPAFAQAPALAPSHLQAAREVMTLTGVTQNIDNIYREFEESAKQLIATRPEAKKDMEAVVAELKPEADRRAEEMTKTAAAIFASKMTEADLKAVSAFFNSDVGKRYTSLRSEAMQALFKELEPWSVQTSNYLFDRFSQEMRKRGHTL